MWTTSRLGRSHLGRAKRSRGALYNRLWSSSRSLDPEIRRVLGRESERARPQGGRVARRGIRWSAGKELERRGLNKFRPVCYLTDEWGCPDQQPVLGIPFYLADAKLRRLEKGG